jgi:hypothetical protein
MQWELFLDSINRWHSTSFYRACTENSVKDFSKGERHCGDPSHVKLSGATDLLLCLEQSLALRGAAVVEICDFLWYSVAVIGCSDPEEYMRSRVFFRREAESWRWEKDILPLPLWEADDWESLEVSVLHVRNEVCAQSSFGTFWDGLPGPALKRIRDKALS